MMQAGTPGYDRQIGGGGAPGGGGAGGINEGPRQVTTMDVIQSLESIISSFEKLGRMAEFLCERVAGASVTPPQPANSVNARDEKIVAPGSINAQLGIMANELGSHEVRLRMNLDALMRHFAV